MSTGAAKVQGPFQLVDASGQDGLPFCTLPFSAVAGCQILLSVTDNYGIQQVALNANSPMFWATLELTIWGSVQGYATCLKRQQVRMNSGPMTYVFPSEESYSEVILRGRNVSGGRPSPFFDPTLNIIANSGSGFSLAATVHIQPTSGIGFGPLNKAPGRTFIG